MLKYFFLLLTIISISCRKDANDNYANSLENSPDVSAVSSILLTEIILNEFEFMTRNAISATPSAGFLSCATITSSTISSGERVEISFSSSAACTDSTIRAGKVLLTYYIGSTEVIVEPINYKIGNVTVKGTFTFHPVVENQISYVKFSTRNAEFGLANADYIKITGDRKNFYKEGGSTDATSDDVIETLEADYNYSIKNGSDISTVEANAETPLIVKYACKQPFRPKGGKLAFARSNAAKRILNFGNGNCLDQPTLQ